MESTQRPPPQVVQKEGLITSNSNGEGNAHSAVLAANVSRKKYISATIIMRKKFIFLALGSLVRLNLRSRDSRKQRHHGY